MSPPPLEPALAPARSVEPAVTSNASRRRTVALMAMGLLALAAWMLLHPFAGITHDAVLYSLFALARLHPDTLTADVFLRFGSQDNFSLFTPIYAAAMRQFGMEHAALLLVLLFQAAVLACVWLLARRFMPALEAALSVAMLVALPDEYGMGNAFHLLEGFITARIPAEALVMGAVLAAVTQRYSVAAGCVIAAMLLHPIMGVVGAAFLVLTYLVPRYPRATLALLSVGFIATLAIVIAIAPLGRVEDKDWLYTIYSASSYLFVSMWPLFDWSRVAVYLVILTIGCWVSATPQLRQICRGLLATIACGVVISLIFCDRLHVSLFIDLQAWRWLWLGEAAAITVAPAILCACWQRGYAGRTAVVALGAAWVFRDLPSDLLLDAAIVACAAVPSKWDGRRYWRPLVMGAWVLTGLAICLDISNVLGYVPEVTSYTPASVQKARVVCADGVVPGVLLISCWIVLRRMASNNARPQLASGAVLTIALTAALICGWLIPFTWANSTITHYTPELASRFAPWRAEIPPRAEVMWLENPVGTWSLLDRPSYTSGPQAVGAIFSREKTLLVQHREAIVATALHASRLDGENGLIAHKDRTMAPFGVLHLNLDGMRALCTDPDLSYIVNSAAPVRTPFPPVTLDATKANGTVYLYRCTELRS